MARSLFIVQGEGKGHMSQAIALKDYLADAGHTVDAVLLGTGKPDRVPDYFREAFPDNLRIFRSPFFLRTPNKKGIYVGRTLLFNLWHAVAYCREISRIRKQIRILKPDVIFNFYELLGALAMRKIDPGIRRIGLGHHFYLHLNRSTFRMGPVWHRMLLERHTRMILRSCDRILALSFREEQGNDHIEVFPPLIRREFRAIRHVPGRSYLAYFLQEGFMYDLVQMAMEDPEFQVDLFTSLNPRMELPAGIRLHVFEAKKFSNLMASCKGLITTAGFDSAAEAAFHGIPLAVIPSRNHFEQQCNAADIKAKGIGVSGMYLDKGLLEQMQSLESHDNRAWVEQAARLLNTVLER